MSIENEQIKAKGGLLLGSSESSPAILGSDGKVGGPEGSALTASVVTGSALGITSIQPTTTLGGSLVGNLPSPTFRDLVSCQDAAFGAVPDFNMTGTTITISGGSLNQGTIGTVPGDLVAGKTMVIAGLALPLLVQSVNVGTKVITFTTEASGAAAAAMCAWGTDNTAALNAWFAYLLENHRIGLLPSGRFLITGTVGRSDTGAGWSGLCIYAGGASVNPARLANLGKYSGTTLVWGGAVGGTMMAFNRVAFVRFVGGINLVGQPSYDPSGVFTTFGNRGGVGYKLLQTSTPETGTGYNFFDDLMVGDLDLGVQFAVNQNDNNCDTTRFNRLIGWRCNQVGLASGNQQLAYTIGFAHWVACGRGFVLNGGGALDIQELNASSCVPTASRTDAEAAATNGASTVTDTAIRASDAGRLVTGTNVPAACYVGTVTPGVSFTTVIAPGSITAATMTGAVSGVTLGRVFTGVEVHSGVNGSNTHIGLMRIENGTYACVYVGGASAVSIDSFEEVAESAKLNLFFIDGGGSAGGMLHIGQMVMYGYNEVGSEANTPIYIGAGSSRSGQILIDQAMWSGPGGQIGSSLSFYITANNNAYADVTVRLLRDNSGNTYNPINTRLQRGKCFLYGRTTNETTAVTLVQAGMPEAAAFAYGPQVPKGYAIMTITIIGDRGDGTFSRFQRQLNVSRTSGEATAVFTTPTGWTDTVEGTDQITTLSVTANKTLRMQMKGTTGKTINWQATVEMSAWTAAVAL